MTDPVLPVHIAYAFGEPERDDTKEVLLGISVPAYGMTNPVNIRPADWSKVHYIAHAVTPHGIPTLRTPDADPYDLRSWVLPDIGSDAWDSCLIESALPESPEQATGSWYRLTMRAAHQERRTHAENLDGELLAELLSRVVRLGWRSISVARLVAVATGDESQLPAVDAAALQKIARRGRAIGT